MYNDEDFFEFYDWYIQNNAARIRPKFKQKNKEKKDTINLANEITKKHLLMRYRLWKANELNDTNSDSDTEVIINFNSKVK